VTPTEVPIIWMLGLFVAFLIGFVAATYIARRRR
jgi:hypothetical protein